MSHTISTQTGIGHLPCRAAATVAAMLLACAAMTGCASMMPRHLEHGAFIVTATADVVHTTAALDRGAQELNPLLGDRPGIRTLIGAKVLSWAVVVEIESAIEQAKGRLLHWWERVLLWAFPIGLNAWAAVHNAGVCRPGCDR